MKKQGHMTLSKILNCLTEFENVEMNEMIVKELKYMALKIIYD
jgi:hypothetical protein